MSDTGAALREVLGARRIVFVGAGVVLAGLILLPIVVVLSASVNPSKFLAFPPHGITTRWFSDLGSEPIWQESALLSLKIGILAATIAAGCGLLASLALRNARPSVARGLRSAFMAPLVVPYIIFALGIFNVLSELPRMGAFWPIVLGHAALAFPLAVMLISTSLATIDPTLSRAASSLGSSPTRVLWRIELPLIKGAIAAAWLLAFAFSFDEVVIPLFLSTPGEQTLPVTIWQAINDFVTPVVAAAAVCVIAAAALLGALTQVLLGRRARKAGPARPAPRRGDGDPLAGTDALGTPTVG